MSLLKRLVFAVHRGAARLQLHVLPRHYYSNVADLHELEATRSTWARRSEMAGVEWDVATQERALREICLPCRDEYGANETYRSAVTGKFGPGYGPVEAQVLHAVVRHFRPRRIIEVGSGVSTACLRAAAGLNARDAGSRARITCIEPYPSDALKALDDVDLVSRPVQSVPPAVFEELGEGDLLFIDSSHSAKTGSDVAYLFLEVLPRLRPGADDRRPGYGRGRAAGVPEPPLPVRHLPADHGIVLESDSRSFLKLPSVSMISSRSIP
jgi:predicted O-methyltransferase YrrM